jgi:hypothetical protein
MLILHNIDGPQAGRDGVDVVGGDVVEAHRCRVRHLGGWVDGCRLGMGRVRVVVVVVVVVLWLRIEGWIGEEGADGMGGSLRLGTCRCGVGG